MADIKFGSDLKKFKQQFFTTENSCHQRGGEMLGDPFKSSFFAQLSLQSASFFMGNITFVAENFLSFKFLG